MSTFEQHAWTLGYLDKIRSNALPTLLSRAELLTDAEIARFYNSMLTSRLLDLRSRLLQAKGQSFYTIGSSGHEANCVVASALRVNDPAFLHYAAALFLLNAVSNSRAQRQFMICCCRLVPPATTRFLAVAIKCLEV